MIIFEEINNTNHTMQTDKQENKENKEMCTPPKPKLQIPKGWIESLDFFPDIEETDNEEDVDF